MEVLILTVFVSLVLAALGVGLFVWSAKSRTFEHSDRLAILPLEDEIKVPEVATARTTARDSSSNPVEA
ncbi:MAG: cbb3-type cytochrome oxidase assembly protein CcoS [Sandaracinaceae bacterium]|nr:cbb3-type cytochrome oxidase assembly protein CcoS [Sandaracinaceae bacterium]